MHRAVDPPTCADCGYDLTGVPIVADAIRCPECGGCRVRLYRWWEPRLSGARALLYLPASLVVGLPAAAVGWLVLSDTGGQAGWLLWAAPPYLLLGLVLCLWRPGMHAGVTVIGLTAVLAGLLGLLIAVAMLLVLPILPLVAVPLGVVYYALPVPLGVLWAYEVLHDPEGSEAG